MQIVHGKSGWIEVICGPMFSGKSEELIKRIRRAQIARRRVQIFKHGIDARYDATNIVSHSQQSLPGVAVTDARDILNLVDDRTELVAIDEGQFFGEEIVEVANQLANLGKRVVVAGLDLDYRGLPFGPMPELMCARRVRHQAAGHLHDLRRSRQLHAAVDRATRTRSWSAPRRPTRPAAATTSSRRRRRVRAGRRDRS